MKHDTFFQHDTPLSGGKVRRIRFVLVDDEIMVSMIQGTPPRPGQHCGTVHISLNEADTLSDLIKEGVVGKKVRMKKNELKERIEQLENAMSMAESLIPKADHSLTSEELWDRLESAKGLLS